MAATIATLAAVDDAVTRRAVEIERAFLAELGSGCSMPVGAHVVDRTMYTFLAADHDAGAGSATVCEQHELSSHGRDTPAFEADLELARRAARSARAAVG